MNKKTKEKIYYVAKKVTREDVVRFVRIPNSGLFSPIYRFVGFRENDEEKLKKRWKEAVYKKLIF